MPTMITVVSVASSIATHMTPRLLLSSARLKREHQRLIERVIEPQEARA